MSFDINKIKIESDIPEIGRLIDDQYPYQGINNIRYTARGLIENSKGKFCFLHIVGEDYFGKRDHLETCGGGLEENEYLDDCLIREVKEELGYSIKDIKLIGSILDCYNLINRITYSTFFHCYIDEDITLESNRTDEEQSLIKEVLWLDPLEALDWLEKKSINKCDKLVHARDKLALRYYLQNYTSIL